MRDKGDRDQRQHLVEHIQRKNVCSKTDAQGNTVCHDVESKEHIFMLCVPHILKRVQGDKRPHQGDHSGKEHAKPVQLEGDTVPSCK